jgi:acyl carrier protein
LQKLKKIMSGVFRVPEYMISDEANMIDLPGWDSLSHMNLIIEIEHQFEIQLSGDDIAEMQSIPKIVEILNRYQAK